MLKKYEVRGMMEWHPVFVAGRARLRVSFTGGHLGDGVCTPAVCETSDAVVQKVVESSEAFRSGRIRLAATYGGPAPDARPAPSASSAPSAQRKSDVADMEFEALDDAIDFLHMRKGIPTGRLLDKESCQREALALGISIVIKDE